MEKYDAIVGRERYHDVADSISEDFISLIDSITGLYTRVVDVALRSRYASEEDLKQVKYVKKICATFIDCFNDKI